ncbi:MAG: hypothetical protein RL748_25 [Pseudomonadota bacterium]|jgi:hypothetical protein
MIRILVICEGPTESRFVTRVLAPYLQPKGRLLFPTLISSRAGNGCGGNVTVERLANAAQKHYFQAHRVTTLVDYYGFRRLAGRSHATLLQEITDAVKKTVGQPYNPHHFHAYVQMHEFEALLFSNIEKFDTLPDGFNKQARTKLETVIRQFDPEDINNSPETAPSKRLEQIFPYGCYGKVEHGALIAEAIGIDTIRARCPGFDAWVTLMENW